MYIKYTIIRFSFKIRLHISVLKEEQWCVDFENAVALQQNAYEHLTHTHTICSIPALLTAFDLFVQFLLHFSMVLFYKTKQLKKTSHFFKTSESILFYC